MYTQSFISNGSFGPTKRRIVEARANVRAGVIRGKDIFFNTLSFKDHPRLDPDLPMIQRLAVINKSAMETLSGRTSLTAEQLRMMGIFMRKARRNEQRRGKKMPSVNPASKFFQVEQATGKNINWDIDTSIGKQLATVVALAKLPPNQIVDINGWSSAMQQVRQLGTRSR